VFDLLDVEFAFLRSRVEVVLLEPSKDLSDVFLVFFLAAGVYQDVHVVEDVVHKSLESRRRVRHSKGHNEVFEGAVSCSKSRLPLVSFSYADVVIAPA
ncbi:hypothetical protein K525DRAFT_213867, partial [Schizophyllum commune Loenen D]